MRGAALTLGGPGRRSRTLERADTFGAAGMYTRSARSATAGPYTRSGADASVRGMVGSAAHAPVEGGVDPATADAAGAHAQARPYVAADAPRLGPFAVLERIGTGGMSKVWRGVHLSSGVAVAIKVADLGRNLDLDAAAAFTREVEAVASLDHPNVIAVLDHGTVPSDVGEALGIGDRNAAPYIVMEYASRGTLLDVRFPLDWVDLVNLCGGILRGLGHAHAYGIIHRDIKPGNVLLGSTADLRPSVKLADFGIADALVHHRRVTGEFTASSVEAALGTPRYMAPEQFRGRWRDYGPWTDLYAFGVMVWELVTGEVPFASMSPYELARMHLHDPLPVFRPRFPVPDALRGWLARLLAKERRDRYTGVAQALAELSAIDEAWLASLAPCDALRARSRAAQPPDGASQRHARAILDGAGASLFALRAPPVVGRDEVVQMVDDELAAAVRGGVLRTAVVSGQRGAGVADFVDATLRRLDETGAARALPRVDVGDAGENAYVAELLKVSYRCVGLSADDTEARLRSELEADGLDVVSAGVLATRAAWASGETTPMREAVRDALGTWLRVQSRGGPLVAVAATDPRRRVACALTRAALALEAAGRGVPLLLLVDQEADALGGVAAWPCRVDRCLSLTPVGDVAALEIVRSMLPLQPEHAQAAVDAAQGMPGALMATLLAWASDAAMLCTDDAQYDGAMGAPPPTPPLWSASTAPSIVDPSRWARTVRRSAAKAAE